MNRRALLTGLAAAAPAWCAPPPIHLTGPDGLPVTIDPAASRATLLLFLSTVCPISNDYQDRIHALLTRFAGQNVRILLIDSNGNESNEDARQYAADAKFPVPLYKDWRNRVADRFAANVTPEAVLLDPAGTIRYRGAIDDARNPARVRIEAARIALDDLLAGRPVSVKPVRAFGCAIKKVSLP